MGFSCTVRHGGCLIHAQFQILWTSYAQVARADGTSEYFSYLRLTAVRVYGWNWRKLEAKKKWPFVACHEMVFLFRTIFTAGWFDMCQCMI